METKVEDMEQEETKPTEDGDNGTNRAEAFTHKENKVVVSEQSETKPTEDVDKELNKLKHMMRMCPLISLVMSRTHKRKQQILNTPKNLLVKMFRKHKLLRPQRK